MTQHTLDPAGNTGNTGNSPKVPAPRSGAGAPRPGAPRVPRTLSPRTLLITAVAWLLAALFLMPYAEMIVTALRPAQELRDATYLPSAFEWANFVDVWR
ncbi:carbohydrate ABC transporter permease, partial [Streptomyces sp. NPDC059352]